MPAIFLLHGLGGRPFTLWPLMAYLGLHGYTNAQTIAYPADTASMEKCLKHIHDGIAAVIEPGDPIMLIGQSMGGLMANNLARAWPDLNVVFSVMIGAPLHGARLLNQLDAILPVFVRNLLNKPVPYEFLRTKGRDEPPPHAYHTISMGWAWTDFDRCVYRDEAMHDQNHHTHFVWMDHGVGFADPRLWHAVARALNAYIGDKKRN